MSWLELHQRSESLAAEAEMAARSNAKERAEQLYVEAAELESQALESVLPSKTRTRGITAVSAVALWFKARKFGEAQKLAHRVLACQNLPNFAVQQLQALLQAIWSEEVRQTAGFKFSHGELLVSVAGGQSVTGGAPLDFVVRKVEGVQALFFRTVELLQQRPHRKRGSAPWDVQSICRPWLFQAPAGSYQFAIAIEEVAQRSLFGPDLPSTEEIKETFMSLIRAATEDPEKGLAEKVPDLEYRGTFLKLTRALAPTGKDFSTLTIRRSSADMDPISLNAGSRKIINEVIRRHFTKPSEPNEVDGELRGVLRAVDLNHDWLEVTTDEQHDVKVYGVGDTVDDVVGPLVNHQVIVRIVTRPNGQHVFRDIEALQ
jgi:hypothetical protein